MSGARSLSQENFESILQQLDDFDKYYTTHHEVFTKTNPFERELGNLLPIILGVEWSIIETTEIVEKTLIEHVCQLSPDDRKIFASLIVDGHATSSCNPRTTPVMSRPEYQVEYENISREQYKRFHQIYLDHFGIFLAIGLDKDRRPTSFGFTISQLITVLKDIAAKKLGITLPPPMRPKGAEKDKQLSSHSMFAGTASSSSTKPKDNVCDQLRKSFSCVIL